MHSGLEYSGNEIFGKILLRCAKTELKSANLFGCQQDCPARVAFAVVIGWMGIG